MSRSNLSNLVAVVGLVLMLVSLADSSPRKKQRLATGTWGGQSIRIAVRNGSAAIEYDCANGTITGPLTLDGKGNFRWKGTHARERGGPTRMGDSQGEPAIYSGSVKGSTLTLTVKLESVEEPIGTFTLVRGNQGKIFKCK